MLVLRHWTWLLVPMAELWSAKLNQIVFLSFLLCLCVLSRLSWHETQHSGMCSDSVKYVHVGPRFDTDESNSFMSCTSTDQSTKEWRRVVRPYHCNLCRPPTQWQLLVADTILQECHDSTMSIKLGLFVLKKYDYLWPCCVYLRG